MYGINIVPSDIEDRLPRALTPMEKEKTQTLIDDAEALIAEGFFHCGKSLENYLEQGEHRKRIYTMVVADMVSAPILVGISRGLKSAQSTTAHQSDSATWADTRGLTWGGVVLGDSHKDLLGINCKGSKVRHRFPGLSYLGEVREHERNYQGFRQRNF